MNFLEALFKIAKYALSNFTVENCREVGLYDVTKPEDIRPELTNDGFILRFGEFGGAFGLYEFQGVIFYDVTGVYGSYAGVVHFWWHEEARELYEEVVDYLLGQ